MANVQNTQKFQVEISVFEIKTPKGIEIIAKHTHTGEIEMWIALAENSNMIASIFNFKNTSNDNPFLNAMCQKLCKLLRWGTGSRLPIH